MPEHCGKALAIEPNSVKALFRRGRAYVALKDYDRAQADLDRRARALLRLWRAAARPGAGR